MREMQDRSVEFKQQRRLNCLKTKSRNKSESNREEISYKIVITVTLDPDVLQKAVVTPQELKECKKYVPAFRKRPSKKYITCPDDKKKCYRLYLCNIWHGKQAMEAASWNHSISNQNKDRNVIFHIYNADKRNFFWCSSF